jgi:putative transposase
MMEEATGQRRNLLKLNVHLVWVTKHRLPLIGVDEERRLYRNIAAMFQRYEASVLAIGGMPDHVHILVSLSPKYALSEVIKNVKGSTSRFFSQTLKPGAWFHWQPNYAAIHVSPSDVERIRQYILNQKQHHTDGTIWPDYEQADEIADAQLVEDHV